MGSFSLKTLLRFKWLILAVFVGASIFSIIASQLVNVNYDVMSYLPKDSPSTIAIKRIEEIFDTRVGSDTRIMVGVSSIPEALKYKERLREVEDIKNVNWLDDVVNVNQPESFIDSDTMSQYYSDGFALFTVTFQDEATDAEILAAVETMKEICGENMAIAGGDAGELARKGEGDAQTTQMMLMLIPLVLVIMLIATSSWLEPILFLAVIGIAILINFGTNIFFGEISFVSQTTAAALQLAVSMDYSIFLLHSFRQQRERGLEPVVAMGAARKQTFTSIIASGVTTLCGFLALILMRFEIGADLGIVLAKGVVISLITVIFLLPVLTMLIYKPLEKLSHRSFLPSFKGFSRFVLRIGTPVMILVAIIVVPAYLGQAKNDFIYMTGEEAGSDTAIIAEEFGRAEQLVLLVPSGDMFTERSMADEIKGLPEVTEVQSYVTTVGMEIPFESLPQNMRDQLSSGGYSSMMLTVNAQQDTKEGFDVVEHVRQIAQGHYGDGYYLAGTLASLYDMRDVVSADMMVTSLAAILAIAIVILLTFRSPLMVVLLVGTIEISIWINLAIPYFMNVPITFLGYTIISAVQLGATVDYAILYYSRYKEKRQSLDRVEASKQAVSETAGSILTSASILFGVGMIITSISSEEMIIEMGMLIGRGAALSAAMVLLFLPNIIKAWDKLILKSTYKSGFTKEARR
jgi:predicted RND superfamily exporter protein